MIFLFPVYAGNSSQCELKLRNRRYWKKNDELLTWYKARNACRNAAGDLASFEMLKEGVVLKVALTGLNLSANTGYWIGMYKGVWKCNDTDIGRSITLHSFRQ